MGNFNKNMEFNLRADERNESEFEGELTKELMQESIEKFALNIEQFPELLGIPTEKVNNILQKNTSTLSDEEISRINHRLTFLSIGFSFIEETERTRVLINSILLEKYRFSYETLALYADVPCSKLKSFCNNSSQIESKYIIKICVNLLMLFFTLNNMPLDGKEDF